MAHTPECEDSVGADWWPDSAPTEFDVSAFPAAGAVTKPVRIPGSSPWLGFWGEFGGARVGISATESFQLRSGTAVPYPGRGYDIYFSADTGAWGAMQVARFRTREAALAWAGTNGFGRTAIPLGPFPAAVALADNLANPTTTEVGANLLLWNGATWERARSFASNSDAQVGNVGSLAAPTWGLNPATGFFDRVRALAISGDGITPATVNTGAQLAAALGVILNDRTTNYDRLRQPDSLSHWSAVGTNVSIASTGVKVSQTMTQAGRVKSAMAFTKSGTPTNAVIALQIVRSAVTYSIGSTAVLSASLNVAQNIMGGTGSNGFPVEHEVLAGDVVQINVIVAAGAAAACDFILSGLQERAAF